MSSKIEPKFYAVDALDAYPQSFGTDDKLELNQEMGAVYVHLNYKRAKLVGLQSLDFLIRNLELIRVEALGSRAAPVVERQPVPDYFVQAIESRDGVFVYASDFAAAQAELTALREDLAAKTDAFEMLGDEYGKLYRSHQSVTGLLSRAYGALDDYQLCEEIKIALHNPTESGASANADKYAYAQNAIDLRARIERLKVGQGEPVAHRVMFNDGHRSGWFDGPPASIDTDDVRDGVIAGVQLAYTAPPELAELQAKYDQLISDCWAACGGNGPANRDDLLTALRLMDEGEDESQATIARLELQLQTRSVKDVVSFAYIETLSARQIHELLTAIHERNQELQAVVNLTAEAFDGGPDHPWIPGFDAQKIYKLVMKAYAPALHSVQSVESPPIKEGSE